MVGECRGVVLGAWLSGQYGESVGQSPPAPGSIPGKSTTGETFAGITKGNQMTRKHFTELAARYGVELANIGNATRTERAARSGYLDSIAATVDTLRSVNPRFDRERFYAAVTMAENKSIARRFLNAEKAKVAS